jgi:transcription initiation factor TFIIB
MSLKATNGGISNSIIEQAKVFYKKISELKLSRGDNREGLIASSIYTSCKKNQVPRSAKEIAKMFNLNITVLTRGRKKFDDIMNMNLKSSNPDDFIIRFCSKMDFADEMIDIARYVVKKEEEYAIISENAPPSIAAGCIYMVNNCCNLGRTKKEISQACDVSEITINKCYKKLHEFRLHLFPEDVVKKYTIG